MRYKKAIIILVSFVLSCTIAYVIGQKIVVPLTHKEDIHQDVKTEYSFIDHFDNIVFEGKREVDTADIPWGSTIAQIQDESMEPSIMMVQGTGLYLQYHVKKNECIQWNYKIHPWVSEASDGMSLYLRVYAAGEEVAKLRRSYIVKPEDAYIFAEVSLAEFEDQDITISFSADNGGNGDAVGDWLVLNKLNIVSNPENDSPQNREEEYWISAHYFADAWPANMWDSEFENIDKDLNQIQSDGFNSIILIIPWRQFQPDIGKTNRYNNDAFDKLDMIMEKADSYHLGVILRVGYTWDYYQNRGYGEILERYENIVNDSKTMSAWLEYVERIYAVANAHDSFRGGFICWEDFWNLITKLGTNSDGNEDPLKYAEDIGFSKYVVENYKISDIRKMYNDNKIYSEEDIYIPPQDSYAFKLVYEYYDDFLNKLLAYSQTAFPDLSMEVRVDDDLIVSKSGDSEYYSHANTYLCKGSNYTTIMYGIPMGFENRGEEVTSQEAVRKMEYILEKVKQSVSNKKIFIDQFLYYDNTQAFSHNARLAEDQIDEYLMEASKLLKQYTRGYGVWPYKDCYADAVANGCFADGFNGWITDGAAEIRRVHGNNKCLLVDGAEIKQDTSRRFADGEESITCSFDALLIESGFTVKLSLNGEEKEVPVESDGIYFVEFSGNKWGELSIAVNGEGLIDNVKLYNFCQQGLLYDVSGKEEKLVDTIRMLNIEMAEKNE